MKYIYHTETGTVFPLNECVVMDSNSDHPHHGILVGESCRETIPCSNCGQEVWDDEENAHVATGSYNCEEN